MCAPEEFNIVINELTQYEAVFQNCMLKKGYNELSREVIESYKTTLSIRQTMKDTKLSFEEVWDMLRYKDWFDFMDTEP